ncbi:MAG TPA: redox-regulated ATPase YchF [Ktedonobacterales bacterium]|nr:redox-regulated ATPase YchF [Ktedonobacterales bacterium]
MALTVGIIGLPQSGKTSLFNALTKAGAQVSGYPTSTVQANMAVVQVPDERLGVLAEIFQPQKVTPTTVEFVDVAGIGQASDATKREGLSAEFLGHIRNADALAVVVRCFDSPQSPHPLGGVNAERDLDELDAELALTDLGTLERRIDRTAKAAKSGDKKYQTELETLRQVQSALNEGKMAREVEIPTQEEQTVRELFLLTMKPRLYIANVAEDQLGPAADLLAAIADGKVSPEEAIKQQQGDLRSMAQVGGRAKAEGAQAVAVSARLEAELSELPEADAAEYLESLGLPRLGADRVIQAGYTLLNLLSFLTAGEDEVRAWTITRGMKAPQAAGKIHTDIERGFIRAEVVDYDDLVTYRSFAVAREKGLLRVEGKNYVMRDGDVVHFLHS